MIFGCIDPVLNRRENAYTMSSPSRRRNPPICPHCETTLEHKNNPKISQFFCNSCYGFAVFNRELFKIFTAPQIKNLWAASAQEKSHLHCPQCAEIMDSQQFQNISFETCAACKMAWFDIGEWEDIQKSNLQTIANQAHSKEEIKTLLDFEADKHQRKDRAKRKSQPRSPIKAFLALFGMPVEEDEDYLYSTPWITWLIIFLCTALSIYFFKDLNTAVENFGYWPDKGLFNRLYHSTTSFFVHSGWFHLFGNMYFLWVFGDNVEDDLGKWTYFFLLLFATWSGDLTFTWLSSSTAPSIGASGGIFGVITYYLLRFPRRNLVISVFFQFFTIPAWAFGICYVFLDEVIGSVAGGDSTNHLAHFGGALIGAAFFLLHLLDRKSKPE